MSQQGGLQQPVVANNRATSPRARGRGRGGSGPRRSRSPGPKGRIQGNSGKEFSIYKSKFMFDCVPNKITHYKPAKILNDVNLLSIREKSNKRNVESL